VRLALNCVGGRSSLMLAAALTSQGCMVTYGGMSKQSVQCPTGPLIFKDISLRGFWMSRWYEDGHTEERNKMYKNLADWFRDGRLKSTTVSEHPMEDFQSVVGTALEKPNVKQIFVLG